eukprot:TRINITY_DN1946_c1_g1_i1.p1 TRINITY_DN1946_c1_g1~~TRINITY_DN1946_c1_g1_i1.p1  ORF type:complete len:884 (+),score=162.38 TRINITY_DN1946_c1_g1_i1:266-2917(+)
MSDLLLATRVPKAEITTFCCSDGSPYYGLAVSQGKKLFLYDLHNGFRAYKAVNLQEQPRSLQWIRKHICIGFKKQYCIIGTDQQPKPLCNVTDFPVVHVLPIEELVLAVRNKALFSFANGKKSRDSLELQNVSSQFAFFFPFLASLGGDSIELKNLVDPNYNEVLRRPSENPIRLITTDGKELVAAEAKTVYILVPNDTNYWVMDPLMFREVRKNPMDKVAFTRYVSQLMRDEGNPFHLLLCQFADRFVSKFFNPEEADLELVKKFLLISMRKFYKVILSYFKHFKLKSCRQLLYGVIQTSYYTKIYWILYAMITCRFKQEDMKYYSEATTFQHYTPESLGVEKRFWLMEESLQDPPKKKQPVAFDEVPRPSPKKQPSQKQDFALPSGPMPDVNPAEEEPDYDYAALIVEEEGFIRFEPSQPQSPSQTPEDKTRKPSRRSSNSAGLNCALALSEDVRDIFITNDADFSLNVEVDLQVLIDPLAGSRSVTTGILSVDPSFQLFIRPHCLAVPIYIRPSGNFAYSDAKQSMTWEQHKRHYRVIFNDEYEYEDAKQQITSWFDLGFYEPTQHPDSDKILEGLCESTTKVKKEDTKDPNPFGDTDSESVDIGSEEGIKRSESKKNSDDKLRSSTSSSIFVTSVTNTNTNTNTNVNANDTNANLNTNSEVKKTEPENLFSDDDVQLEFKVEPYRKAIHTLRKISFLKSPRDKLGCILHTFMDVIQCVTDFWNAHDCDPVVSADDLVPIFSYVILKAHVPKLYSEMNFIWEFATDSEMKGKYGYSFATFQIGVEVIARLSQEEAMRVLANEVKAANEASVTVGDDTFMKRDPEDTKTTDEASIPHALHDIKSKRDNNLNSKRSEIERRTSRSNNMIEHNETLEGGDYFG